MAAYKAPVAVLARSVWINSLGMRFVPIPETTVSFSIWETRVQDFQAFVRATRYDATRGVYSIKNTSWGRNGNTWINTAFPQTPSHPVCSVSWVDAKAFCAWLSKKERAEGRITARQSYRLPHEQEWDKAVGNTKYPWGNEWPPPREAGNYAGKELNNQNWPKWAILADLSGSICEDSTGGELPAEPLWHLRSRREPERVVRGSGQQ